MLTVKDLHFSYGHRPILNGVSLEVGQGELVGLVGPNGAGKTTLLRMITGVLDPYEGEVLLLGEDVARLSREEIARRVAVLPQNPLIPEAFSPLEVVLMARTPHLRFLQWEGSRDLDIARRAMEATQTWGFQARHMGELSGGERQRVLIARALAQESPLLLMDEPTVHLDIGYQEATFGLVRQLLEEGRLRAVLAVVHDLTLAARYCHRLFMLKDGCIVAQGTPAEVLTVDRIQEVYQASVALVRHPVDGSLAVIPGPSNSDH